MIRPLGWPGDLLAQVKRSGYSGQGFHFADDTQQGAREGLAHLLPPPLPGGLLQKQGAQGL